MKKLLLLALTVVVMAGCESDITYTKYQTITQNVGVFEYDSCEYITIYNGISHKGNCRFCAERRKQELKELIKELKE